MAFVVMRDAFGIAKTHRQHRLRALQRLALALLVNANNQRVLRRAQVQANHVAQLFDEERIIGEVSGDASPQRISLPRHTRGM